MTKARTDRSSTKKVAAHRARLRAQGLRPVQIWAPDTRTEAFAREARRQSRLLANSSWLAGDQAFIDAISRDAIDWSD